MEEADPTLIPVRRIHTARRIRHCKGPDPGITPKCDSGALQIHICEDSGFARFHGAAGKRSGGGGFH